MAEHDVVRGHRKVARDVQLVAAAHDHAVEPRHDRLGAILDRLDRLDEAAHPVPVVVRPAQECLLLVQVGASRESAVAGAGEHDDADMVVGGRLAKRVAQAFQGGPIERVEDLRPIDADRRHPTSDVVVDGHADQGSSSATSVRSPGAISRRFLPATRISSLAIAASSAA